MLKQSWQEETKHMENSKKNTLHHSKNSKDKQWSDIFQEQIRCLYIWSKVIKEKPLKTNWRYKQGRQHTRTYKFKWKYTLPFYEVVWFKRSIVKGPYWKQKDQLELVRNGSDFDWIQTVDTEKSKWCQNTVVGWLWFVYGLGLERQEWETIKK